MKRITVGILLLTVVISCNKRRSENPKGGSFQLIMDEKYESALSFFGPDKTYHFPPTPDFNNYIFTESYSPIMGNLELILWNKESEPGDANNFGEQSFNPIAHYSAGDTCLLIVNRFINRKELHNASPSEQELRLIDRDCYLDKYPIPNFWHTDYTVDKTQCRLPQDFEIYVLDAKPGKFKDDELLTDGRFMPEKWKNGYSVGYAVSKQRTALVYWLLIW